MKITGPEWKALFDLLDKFLELEESERPPFLEQLAHGSPELREQFERLLAKNARNQSVDSLSELSPGGVMPAIRHIRHSPATFTSGAEIGPYRLVREIGLGGMSSVWLATRSDGALQRELALKLPHIDLHKAGLAERFARERDILAALTHPHIARLYDAGISDSGQPFLAMEYVEGVPILEHCASRRIDIAGRMTLYLQILDAVQYAHSKLVLHRDLKPTNILVTDHGQIRLLDFGIAKLIVEGSASETELTRFGGRALTLAYASPEQILGRPLGTASDVYSLAIVAHELLTGARPYRPPDDSQVALEQAILTTPPRPLSEATREDQAALCGTTRAKLQESLRGDLEAIVSKALRKEPELRYQTVDALREDLLRHQRSEPVEARRGARGYVFGRFMRRHRWLIAATTLALLLTWAAATAIAWQGHMATLAAARADVEAKKANAVKDFLLDIFKQSSLTNPSGARGRQVTAEQLLDIGAQRIRFKLRDEPALRGELLDTLGLLYGDLGFPDREAALAEEHFAGISHLASGEDAQLETERVQMRWGVALANTRPADAIAHLDAALRIIDGRADRDSLDRATVLLALARAEYGSKTVSHMQSSRNLLAALSIVDRRDPENPLRADITEELGSYAKLADDYPSAERWERQSLDSWERSGAEANAFYIGRANYLLGDTLALQHRFPEAEADLRRAIDMITRSAGADHPYAAEAKLRLGEMYGKMARPGEGIQLLQEALTSQLKTPEGIHESTETIKTLARLNYQRGNLPTAETLLRQNIAQLAAEQSNELRYGLSASNIAPVLAARDKFDEAEHFYAIATDVLSRYLGENSLGYAYHSIRGVRVALEHGDASLAAQRAQSILVKWPNLREQLPAEFDWISGVVARERSRRGGALDAIAALSGILDRIAASSEHGYQKDGEARIQYFLGITLTEAHRPAEGQTHLRRAVQLREAVDDIDSPWLAQARIGLANSLIAGGIVPEARALLRTAAGTLRNQKLSPIYYSDLLAARARVP
jgi:serine/threonine-protein kinase